MIKSLLQRTEVGISNRLAVLNERHRDTINTSTIEALLNLEILATTLAHAAFSAAVTVVEVVTPRSTE